MDPNEALRRIRELADEIGRDLDDAHAADCRLEEATAAKVSDLLNHVDGLDRWLSQGGFLPAAWDEKR